MLKKYDCRTGTITEITEVDDEKQVENRTRAFIQWCKFNKCQPSEMALAVLRNKKMHFLTNCEMLVDTDVKCSGKTYEYYCYGWKDSYFELINKARALFWRYIEEKNDKEDKKEKD